MELTDKIFGKFVKTRIGYIIATHPKMSFGVGALIMGYFYGKGDDESITTDAIESVLISAATGILTKYVNKTDWKDSAKNSSAMAIGFFIGQTISKYI